jgi:hypothetical protein
MHKQLLQTLCISTCYIVTVCMQSLNLFQAVSHYFPVRLCHLFSIIAMLMLKSCTCRQMIVCKHAIPCILLHLQ